MGYVIGFIVGLGIGLLIFFFHEKPNNIGKIEVIVDEASPNDMPTMLLNLDVGVTEMMTLNQVTVKIEVVHWGTQK